MSKGLSPKGFTFSNVVVRKLSHKHPTYSKSYQVINITPTFKKLLNLLGPYIKAGYIVTYKEDVKDRTVVASGSVIPVEPKLL